MTVSGNSSAAVEPPQTRTLAVRPFGAGATLFAGVVGSLVLWWARVPGFDRFTALVVGSAAGLLVAAWPAGHLLGVGLLAAVRPGRPRPEVDLRGLRLCAGWLVVVALALAVQLPLRLNFLVSRSALDGAARSVAAGGTPSMPDYLGGFLVDRVERRGGGVVFWMPGDAAGYAALSWCPGEQPCFRLSGSNGHLGGPWFWSQDD